MGSYDPAYADEQPIPGLKIILHPLHHPKLLPWFNLRVFYVRVSNCLIDETTPDHLTINHIPLSPDSILEVNGRKSNTHSKYVTSLWRSRADKSSEEATFVSIDSISMTGGVRFEVHGRDCLLLTGVLESCNSDDQETQKLNKKWSMTCKSAVSINMRFQKNVQIITTETDLPMVEVYVAGCFSGAPIILTKTLQIGVLKKHRRRGILDSIPEDGATEAKKDVAFGGDLELSEYRAYKAETDSDCDYEYEGIYGRAEYLEGEDGELSWFNAGVSIGVGIGVGVCLGIGLGVGLLVRTYRSTTLNLKKRLI